MPRQEPPPRAPVLVVGNGPVGQTTALLLARWGIRSVLLDRREERDFVGSRAICQHRDVLDVWEAVGAGRSIAERGVTWSTARTYFRDDELFCLHLSDPGRSPFPPFVNISQSRTEQVLAARIAESPLIEERWSTEVERIEQSDSSVTLTARAPTGELELEAPYVVLAAGAHGRSLREQLGIPFPGRSYRDRFLICDIRAALPGQEQERRFYFDPRWNPGRQVLIHPCPDDVYRIDWQVPEDFDLEQEHRSGGLDRRIREIVGATADYELVWHSLYRFQGRCAERLRSGRVLLAGDCAHLFSPFGARGLNSGVHDAENAAWKIAFVLHGWAPPSLLDSYDTERRAAALENLDVTETTMRFLVPQNDADHQRRLEVLERAVGDPAVRSAVDSGRLFEPFWYVDSPLTTSDLSRPFPGRPPRGQPPVTTPGVLLPDLPVRHPETGHRTNLRSLTRDGLLLLCHAAGDPAAIAERLRAVTEAPLGVLEMEALRLDVDHAQAPAEAPAVSLGARPGEVWLVRPDSHVAAIVPASTSADRAGSLEGAVGRVLGRG